MDLGPADGLMEEHTLWFGEADGEESELPHSIEGGLLFPAEKFQWFRISGGPTSILQNKAP